MSRTSKAKLCYGIDFSNHYFLPWYDDKYGMDENKWWKTISGLEELPVDLVEHGHHSCEAIIIASKNSCLTAEEYSPIEILKWPTKLLPIDVDKIIVNFCKKYLQPINENFSFPEMKPKWLLVSCYN